MIVVLVTLLLGLQKEKPINIVMVGATGYIGPPLAKVLRDAGHAVTVITRKPAFGAKRLPQGVEVAFVDGYTDEAVTHILSGVEAVVNLAGANVGSGRWTARRKKELLDSRIHTTSSLVDAMAKLSVQERPRTFVSTSGIDYYGDVLDGLVSEDSPPGDSFMADLCVQWEDAARQAESLGIRVALMRMATVLGHRARPLQLRLLPFRFFVGGHFRPGTQWFCWIHKSDALGLYKFAIEEDEIHGPMNVIAPGVLPEVVAASVIGRALKRPSWLPVPANILKLVMGEQSELVLHGRNANPAKALAAGYMFEYGELGGALSQITDHN